MSSDRVTGSPPEVTVIVVNFNTRLLLHACLNSVVTSTVLTEIIVVDNGSVDGSAEMVRKEFPSVILICNKTNERFAKPNNDAMKRARGKYFFLLNSDAELRPGCLEQLVRYLGVHADAGAVGPQLLNPDGSVQPSVRGFVSLWTHVCDMLVLDRLFPTSRLFASSEMTYFDHMSERSVDHVMAAALLIRADVIHKLGPLDERLSIYYNDLDLSLRLRRAGWKIVFLPHAKALHHGGRTARPMMGNREIFLEQYQNIFYYFQKHYGLASLLVYKLLMILGFFPRLVYWSARSLVNRSELVLNQRAVAVKSFLIALTFWRIPMHNLKRGEDVATASR